MTKYKDYIRNLEQYDKIKKTRKEICECGHHKFNHKDDKGKCLLVKHMGVHAKSSKLKK